MCRLYGQISVASASAVDFLVDADRALLRQSDHDKGNPQKDGWGIGYFAGRRAVVAKSPAPACAERERFARLAARARSRVVIGHLRAASNPRGLPGSRVMGAANAQPFTDGAFIFAHNGTLQIPQEVAAFLGAYRKKLRGVNDSEVYFWQFRKFFDAYGSIPEALKACVRETWGIWEGCRRRGAKRSPYTGLNTLVSDGDSLHALCHYPSPAKEGMHGIFNALQPWGTMSAAARGGRFVIASEDLDDRPWTRLRDPEIVSASVERASLRVRRQRFDPRGGAS